MDDDLARRRVEYDGASFTQRDAGDDPMALFRAWFEDAALRDSVPEANAVAFASAATDGTPSNRMVLLKDLDPVAASFTVFTNLDSRKARESLLGSGAALCWWWPGTPGRQVRAVGRVEEVERDAAASYFASRPPAARIGAAVSDQSRPAPDRSGLEVRAAALEEAEVPLPERWGGLRVIADELEFWQGRSGRLHDRIVFLRLEPGGSIASRAAVMAAGGEPSLRDAGTIVTDAHATSWLRVRLQP
jgi:pyridoxamine 5'-phosphate oxidase